ncbi:MAG: hypothetical protein CMM84_19185 [Rhodothermaceae bacterium]|nr:hypothetical protein [Rhodothermaceae bacterium]MBC13131.1 hypothetical protein [Rhodothermaceae bacterium]|tara:strand:+ start:70 stop:555 length:486 start_codon:yes stop_codon:yes gene_type:complete
MSRLVSLLILVLATLLTASATAAQQPQPFTIPSATVQEWQGYALTWRSYDGGTRSATATLYGNTSRHDSDERPYTVVLVQGEGNRAPITEDAKYLAEIIGRDLGVSPTRLAFLFRFAVEDTDRPLTVRATFWLSSSGNLVSPSWRVLSTEEVEDYTDRQLR